MKLATLKSGTRDGRLVVVSRDLTRMRSAAPVAATLQQVLDGWAAAAPALQALYDDLNAGRGSSEPFDAAGCAAPLPRAYQWLDASAYLNHVELVRRARGADMPASFYTDPLMYQGGSDDFLGAHDVTDDVPALTQATVDRAIERPGTHAIMARIVDEMLAIGRAMGIVLDIDGPRRLAMARALGAFKTSMLQDLEAGRPLEIDALLSAPLELAQALDVPAPTTAMVNELLRLRVGQ